MHCCPACNSEEARWTGQLGRRVHVQCRDCGLEYSYLDDEEEDEGPDCDDGDDGYALASAGWGTDEDYGAGDNILGDDY
jgi:hypothetical protein